MTGICMHEFVMSLKDLKKKTGCRPWISPRRFWTTGIHPPTMYFPLIVEEALMVGAYGDRVQGDPG